MDEKLVTEVFLLHEQVCSALGNPHRLLILYALHEQPRYVTDLAEVLDIPQSSVSRHLKVLRDRGLVVTRRDGPAVYYALADTRVIDALELLREMLYDRLHKQVEITHGSYRGKRRAKTLDMP